MARTLSVKLEAIEKDAEMQRRKAALSREEINKLVKMHESLKKELDVITAAASIS